MSFLHEKPGEAGYAQSVHRGPQNEAIRDEHPAQDVLHVVLFALGVVALRTRGVRPMLPPEAFHTSVARPEVMVPQVNVLGVGVANRFRGGQRQLDSPLCARMAWAPAYPQDPYSPSIGHGPILLSAFSIFLSIEDAAGSPVRR